LKPIKYLFLPIAVLCCFGFGWSAVLAALYDQEVNDNLPIKTVEHISLSIDEGTFIPAGFVLGFKVEMLGDIIIAKAIVEDEVNGDMFPKMRKQIASQLIHRNCITTVTLEAFNKVGHSVLEGVSFSCGSGEGLSASAVVVEYENVKLQAKENTLFHLYFTKDFLI